MGRHHRVAGRWRRWLPLGGLLGLAVISSVAFGPNHSASASTTVAGGPITTNTTWNLAGSPYVVTGNVTVNNGVTLTVDAGVVVRFQAATSLIVNGTLASNGTSSSGVTFMSDNVSPAPGAWGQIVSTQGTLTFSYTSISDGGGGAPAAVDCPGCALTADHLAVDHSSSDGLYAKASQFFSVQGSTFSANADHGVLLDNGGGGACPLTCVPVFDNNTLTGNGVAGFLGSAVFHGLAGNSGSGNGRNAIKVAGSTDSGGSGSHVYTFANPLPLAIDGDGLVSPLFQIQTGTGLHLGAGQALQMAPTAVLQVDGLLSSDGTSIAPVAITSDRTIPSPGDWRHIISSNGTLTFSYTTVSYGGGSPSFGAVECAGCSLTADHLTVDHSASHGLYAKNTKFFSVQGSTFNANADHGVLLDNGGVGVCPLTCVPVFDNNTLTGNGVAGFLGSVAFHGLAGNIGSGNGRNAIKLVGSTVGAGSGSSIYTFANPIALAIDGDGLTAPLFQILGSTGLHLGAGQALQMAPNATLQVDGLLSSDGAAANPVSITSDSAVPTPGLWQRIISSNGTLTFSYTSVSYGGGTGVLGAVECGGCALTADHLTVDHSARHGLYAKNTQFFSVQGSTFNSNTDHGVLLDNGGVGVCPLTCVPVFDNNTLTGNGVAGFLGSVAFHGLAGNSGSGNGRNAIKLVGSTVGAGSGSSIYTFANPLALAIDGDGLTAPLFQILGATGVHLGAGQALQMAPNATLQVDGLLSSDGTATNPVSITSDSAVPTPGLWQRIISSNGTLTFSYTSVSYGGGTGVLGAVECGGCALTADHLTVDHSARHGLYAKNTQFFSVQGSTFSSNTDHGVFLDNGGAGACPLTCAPVFDNNTLTGNGVAGFLGSAVFHGLAGNSGSANGRNAIKVVGDTDSGGSGTHQYTFSNLMPLALDGDGLTAPLFLVRGGTGLHLGAGQALQMAPGAALQADGLLTGDGSAASPVTITSDRASPSPGDWGRILGSSGGTLTFTYTRVGYGGGSGALAAVECAGCTLATNHLSVDHSANHGLVVTGGSPAAEVDYSTFTDEFGAGITTGSSLSGRNDDLVGNATGLAVTGGTTALDSSIIRSNTTGVSVSGGTLSLSYSILSGNATAASGIPDPTPANHNLGSDPLFRNEGTRDLHLQVASPAIDAGDPAFLDPDGTRLDIGVYPFGAGVTITVTPASASVAKGLYKQFTATVTYQDGTTADATGVASWASSQPSVATITPTTGLAHAVDVGTTNLSATRGGASGSTPLTVTPPALTGITVTPVNPSVAQGLDQQFKATGSYTDGSTADITMACTWASGTPSVATVGASTGLAHAVGQGTSTITATQGAVAGSTVMKVTPPALTGITVTPANPSVAKGLDQQFTATGSYTDGSTADITTVSAWTSGTPAVATVGAGTGLAHAVAQGTSTISATQGAVSGSTLMTVTAPALTGITVTPANPSVAQGLNQQFTATGSYTDGSTADITTACAWTSGTPSVATVGASTGLAHAVGQGTSTISATQGAVSGSTVLKVTAPLLTGITVTPANPTVAQGLNQQFTATGSYTDGSTADLTTSSAWTSGAPSVATVGASTGLAHAASLGTATISAAFGGKVGSTVMTVTAPALTGITVTPANPSVAQGLDQQFTATGSYTDGHTADLTTACAWTSGTPSVATVGASTGLAHALAQGTSTIGAAFGEKSGSTVMTVTAPALTGITVAPANPSVAQGLDKQFTATGSYTDGTTADLTNSSAWTSGTPSVATVGASTGLAHAVGQGTSTISAAQGGRVGSTVLTVTAPALTGIAVTPANPSVAQGLNQQFTATGSYTDGTTADLTNSSAWTSGTPSVATVGASTGLAHAVGQGTSTISATQGAVSGSTVLKVTAPALTGITVTPANPSVAKGLDQQFTATGSYTDGSTTDITTASAWTSGTPSVATVGASTGLAHALAQGTSTISAAQGAVSGSTVLKVTAPALTGIAVTPANPSVAQGLNQQFTATGSYTDGTTADLTNASAWTSGTPSVATVGASTGLAHAAGQGTSTITAASGGQSGSTVLKVTAPALTGITVTPANPSVAKGLDQQFTATGSYTDGSTADITTASAWASGTPSVATVGASTGLAHAAGQGTSTISATQGAVSGSTVLKVTAAALTGISVTPANPSVAQGLNQQFVATGSYTDGTTADITTACAWTSDTPAVATVGAGTGLAHAAGQGTATITAAQGGRSGSAVLTVLPLAVSSIAVTPANPSIPRGASQQFTATATYTDGSTADVSSSAAWSSSAPGVATITSTGRADGVSSGTTTISASFGGLSGSTLLTVLSCQNVPGGSGSVSLGSGSHCIFNATIGGSVTVGSGGSLLIRSSSIGGGFSAQGASVITLCGSSLGGSLTVSNSTGFVVIGDPADDSCAGNQIHGSASLSGNSHSAELGHNTIEGSLSLTGTSGTGPNPEDSRPELEGNTISYSLSCSGNTPAPTNDGQPNSVGGSNACGGI